MASSTTGIYAAILGNLAVSITKFVAAAMTGSSAMLTEGIHSLVDTGNGALLLVGIRRSRRPADTAHPFGHGKEVYFYTLIVAVLIFAVGGGVSIYEGILHILSPKPVADVHISYIVIGAAAVFEGIAWTIALKGFLAAKGRASLWGAIRTGKDPTTFAVLFEDSAALAGLAVAALGLFLAERFDMPMLDGTASVVIGTILCLVAAVLVRESKGLLVGESADPDLVTTVRRTVERDAAVVRVGRLLTMHMGPDAILVNLDVEFKTALATGEIASAIDRMEQNIRGVDRRVRHIFIESACLAAAAHRSS